MGRGEHPSAELRCESHGCDRRGYAIDSDGRVLCRDCWSFRELPVVYPVSDGLERISNSGLIPIRWIRRWIRRER